MSRNASAADDASPVSATEANALFDGLSSAPALVLAVSGGPDSTALMMLVARWHAALRRGPALLAVTVDHGLRAGSAREARAVKRLAGALGVGHRTLKWIGAKPATGLQEAARATRYRLLAEAARRAGATHVLTAHTRDDQAETVLMRMARGSGLVGLGGMARDTQLDGVRLVRPLLGLSKARLVATLAAAGVSFADDPSNRDPRFTRARLRGLLPALAEEGLDAGRLALLAHRLRRADETIELAVDVAIEAVCELWPQDGPVAADAERFFRLPAEVALRLLGRAAAHVGMEGPVQLGKLEALFEAFCAAAAARPASARMRRTLAGAQVTLSGSLLSIERAPPRSAPKPQNRLTTRRYGRRKRAKRR